jgi:PhnB protein
MWPLSALSHLDGNSLVDFAPARLYAQRRIQLVEEIIAMAVKPIREGFHAVTPYLMVAGIPQLLTWLTNAFDAKERFRLQRADGSIGHAEVAIGDSMVMLGEPVGAFGPTPTQLYLYVTDCDTVYQRALRAGGTAVMPPTTMPFSGERYGGVKDPSGNLWWIATHIEDVTPEECARRFEDWQRQQAPGPPPA